MKKYRRIYPYQCAECGKGRYTLVFDRKKRGVCHSCLKFQPIPGQMSLMTIEKGEINP